MGIAVASYKYYLFHGLIIPACRWQIAFHGYSGATNRLLYGGWHDRACCSRGWGAARAEGLAAQAMREEQRYLQMDVYSFGVTLWELMERKRPYRGMDPYQIQVPPGAPSGVSQLYYVLAGAVGLDR